MKTLTREQVQSRKQRATRFTRDVRNDPDRAAEIEDESLEHYTERRHIKLSNPKGKRTMATQSRRELVERIKELEGENEELRGQLDDIADIVAPDDEDGNEDNDEGE